MIRRDLIPAGSGQDPDGSAMASTLVAQRIAKSAVAEVNHVAAAFKKCAPDPVVVVVVVVDVVVASGACTCGDALESLTSFVVLFFPFRTPHTHAYTRRYDGFGRGFITPGDFRRALEECGVTLSDGQAARLMPVYDKNGDKRVQVG